MTDFSTNFEPRFVHLLDHGQSPGTIAYVRNNSHVFFAWTKLSPKDLYVKSTGRKLSSTRLKQILPQLLTLADLMLTDITVWHEYNYGFVSSADLVSKDTAISAVLADQQLALLTPMDFKHSYITNFLINKICY